MHTNLLSLYLVSGMLGIMLFFTITVAPTVFKVLPQEWSSKYVRAFFPKYYVFMGIFSFVSAFLNETQIHTYLLIFCTILFLISLFILLPAINRSSDNQNRKYFALLHGATVIINFIQFGIFIYILV